ncbi:Fe2OG dioxygenase domain-containing protein [Mycena venus]|uniref:Fe2OG dioxygenase domain-containing protein n=1 Tax=Mycena venus TaxID=2733690 RepID=A0A8H7D2G4_9AGAR|nr:Fe2OG dioxygenase domain-containing protein [Mycena venus]
MPSSGSQASDVSPEAEATPVADAGTIKQHLKTLKRSLKHSVPYTGGVHPVKADDLVVYYDVEGKPNPRRIDLETATEEALVALESACDKATFGFDQADVLDETYRKAGKIDLTRFASRLDVVSSGLLDAISPDLLAGQSVDSDKVLRAELYKLNVYGPGSFFKAHRDTPRGEDMIGSLVVIFPTEHTGGELTLEHDGTNWTFDAAAKLSEAKSSSSLAYIAFYSDVTHAVEPVRTGYRVTLTYNLFLSDRTNLVVLGERIVPSPEQEFEEALRALLENPAFLPQGGFLAYGLSHQYPIPTSVAKGSRLGHVLQLLKGSDARIRTVSERIGLETRVKMLYDSGEKHWEPLSGHDVVADDILDTEHVYDNEDYSNERMKQLEKKAGMMRESSVEPMDPVEAAVPMHWVTRITEKNKVGSAYMAYGNNVSLEHVYGNAALFVTVPAFGEGLRRQA